MVTALVLLKVKRDRIDEVANVLVDLQGVSEVYSIAGRYDLAAMVRVRDNEELATIVTGRLIKVDGITDSETHIAFRVYSRHDLESMFSLPERAAKPR
ncbi:MAG: Lrp/AsnC ligand binding domain-containing protein [Chitinispirillaceae bacterium]|nr:Lrp/AsnC ligand binding domain-containing protein [Chitinispirillaceae bacterium]